MQDLRVYLGDGVNLTSLKDINYLISLMRYMMQYLKEMRNKAGIRKGGEKDENHI